MLVDYPQRRGLSPIVGAILMVAITVVLAGVVLFFLLGFGVTESPQAGVSVSQSQTGVTLTLTKVVTGDKIHVVVNGTRVHTWDAKDVGQTITVVGVTPGMEATIIGTVDGKKQVLQSFTVSTAAYPSQPVQLKSESEPVTLVWNQSDGGDYLNDVAVETDVGVYVGEDYGYYHKRALNGSLQWRTDTGSNHWDDIDIVNDKLYMTGVTSKAAKRHPNGSLIWEVTFTNYDPVDAGVTPNGTMFVGGGNSISGSDGNLTKIATNGSRLWTNYSLHEVQINDVVVHDGYVYTADIDGVVKKLYLSNGSIIWSRDVYDDGISDMEIHNGYLYAGGWTGTHNATVEKVRITDGTSVDSFKHTGAYEKVRDIEIGPNGNIYSASRPNDPEVIKWTPDGTKLWQYNLSSYTQGLGVDRHGNAYVSLANGDVIKLSETS